MAASSGETGGAAGGEARGRTGILQRDGKGCEIDLLAISSKNYFIA